MTCYARIILRWCSFSVLHLVNRLSFELRESVSALVHILNPLCYIHLNSFFIDSFSANNVSKQSLSVIFSPLQNTAMTLETAAHSATPPQRVFTPLAPPTSPVTARS